MTNYIWKNCTYCFGIGILAEYVYQHGQMYTRACSNCGGGGQYVVYRNGSIAARPGGPWIGRENPPKELQ